MSDQPVNLLKLTKTELDAGSVVLGKAFADYDLYTYYFPDEKERHAVSRTFGFIVLSACLKYGEAYISSNKLEGVSAWFPPGHPSISAWHVISTVPLPVMLRFQREGGDRLEAYGKYAEKVHRKLVPYPHWYLQMIGVDPSYQGQKFSSKLIRPMLERIDREQKACYLETNNRKNVSIYQQFGFELIKEEFVPGTTVENLGMLRKAQTLQT